MSDLGVAMTGIDMAIDTRRDDAFPALRQGRVRRTNEPKLDVARRVLWRAYQRGHLSKDESASTLDRLDVARPLS
jgi:hypothetical protein